MSKGLSPEHILRKVFEHLSTFRGARCELFLSSGQMQGAIEDVCGDGRSGLYLTSNNNDVHTFISGGSILGLSFLNPNPEQLAILRGEVFDPLMDEKSPGNLEINRMLSERVFPLDLDVRATWDENSSEHRKIIMYTLNILDASLKELLSDDFAVEQVRSSCDGVEIGIGPSQCKLRGTTLVVDMSLDPNQRHSKQSLFQELNKVF